MQAIFCALLLRAISAISPPWSANFNAPVIGNDVPYSDQTQPGGKVLAELLHQRKPFDFYNRFTEEFLPDSQAIAQMLATAQYSDIMVSNYPPTKNFTDALRDGLPTINRRISENLLTRSVQRSGLYAYILDKMDTFFTKAFALSDPMSLSFACHHYSPLQMFEVYNSLLNCAPMSWPRVNLTNALMDTFRLIEQSPGWGKLGAEEADDSEHYKSNYIYLAQSSKTFEDYRGNPAAFDAQMKQATDFLTTMIGLDRYTVLRRLAYWSQESNEKCMMDMLRPEYAMRHEYIMEIGQIMVKDLEKIAFLSDICSRVLANEPDYATAYKDQDLLATAQKLSHLLVSKQLYTTYPASDVPRCTPVGEHFPGGRP